MASNPDDVRKAAMVELAKRELARRQQSQQLTPMQQIGNSAANLYRGVASVPNMFLDIPANLHNVIAPNSPPWKTESQKQNEALASLGVKEDTSKAGQVIAAVNRGVGGAIGGLGLGGALAGSTSPTIAGLGSQLTSQPMTQIASAASGSASGDVAKQMGAGPIGQTVASLAGGAVPGLVSAGYQAMTRPQPGNVLGQEDVMQMSKEAYKKAETSGASLPAEDFRTFAEKLGATLDKDPNFHPKLTPRAVVPLEEISKTLDSGQPVSMIDAMRLRGVMKLAGSSPDPNERRISQLMIDKLDDLVSNSDAFPEQARGFYRRAMNADMVDSMVQKAQDSASNYSASGLENSIRREFRNFVRSDSKMRKLTESEQDAMRQVSQGTTLGNMARALGRFAPRGPVSVGADFFIGGATPERLALALGGEAGRQLATKSTVNNVALARQLMLGGPLQPQPPINWPVYGQLAGALQNQGQ
jgi:hypothetical protein